MRSWRNSLTESAKTSRRLSYREVEELLAERGVDVDHVAIHRWVQRFNPRVCGGPPITPPLALLHFSVGTIAAAEDLLWSLDPNGTNNPYNPTAAALVVRL